MVSVLALLSPLLASVAGQSVSSSTLYTATINISSSSWNSRVVSSRPASSVLTCAGHCQDRHESYGDCNSFYYQPASRQSASRQPVVSQPVVSQPVVSQ